MGESFPMTGGNGPNSYSKNSQRQKRSAERVKSLLVAVISDNLNKENFGLSLFSIADLGCSTGPNTFSAMETIIEEIIQKYKIEGHSNLPEFQVFFNDHNSNDFNALFSNLPSDRKYFASGVPGSFHGRLFPKASLNFVYSSFATHWLSRVPEEVGDLTSPAYNKGRIFYGNAPNEVGQAYFAQYSKDMESFLSARAIELAHGGLMVIHVPGRCTGMLPFEGSQSAFFEPLEYCLLQMVHEGLISSDKIDAINLPVYNPSPEEVRALVEKNEQFEVVSLDELAYSSVPYYTTEQCRAVFENILDRHIGSEMVEQVFQRYGKRTEEHPFTAAEDKGAMLFIVLKRKN